ncbi:ATP-binding protein [Litorivicinus sp.]|nr:ATP-binding protein [Litorivicinus sp.]
MTRSLKNDPDARRLIHGLRDTGYNFLTATADVIDNSIAAGASRISVEIELLADGRKFVFIADNGSGMDADELFDALRYGAPERPTKASLGKFGLGLKTASTAICRELQVITRKSPDEPLAKLGWDLDLVDELNEWMMTEDSVSDAERSKFEEYCGDHGTLVIWSKCDRLLQRDYPEEEAAKERAAITRLSRSLTEHVGLVFHRFCDASDERAPNVVLYIDGEEVKPWCPFYKARSEQVLGDRSRTLNLETFDGDEAPMNLGAYILPHRAEMTKEEEKTYAKISSSRQGFYIYRENRLISNGGWHGLFGMEPHFALIRVELDFDHRLDEAFKIDVKKSQIIFDPAVGDVLKDILSGPYREARNRYDRKQTQALDKQQLDHGSSNKTIIDTKNVDEAKVTGVDVAKNIVSVQNNAGDDVLIAGAISQSVGKKPMVVEAVDDISSGDLWEPKFVALDDNYRTGVRLNKHHDFYRKVYQRLSQNRHAVDAMDYLFWAISAAEMNNRNDDLTETFEDLRSIISSNLRKLLRDVDMPDPDQPEQVD